MKFINFEKSAWLSWARMRFLLLSFCVVPQSAAVEPDAFEKYMAQAREKFLEAMSWRKPISEECVKISAAEFYGKFFGLEHWAKVEDDRGLMENQAVAPTVFSAKNREAVVSLVWHENEKAARDFFPDVFARTWSTWEGISEGYQTLSDVGTDSFVSREEKWNRAYFYRNNVSVWISFESACPREEALALMREIDALLCGNAEFLPKDAPEFVEIRAEWEREKERRLQQEREAAKKRQEEFLARERAQRIEEAKAGIFPDGFHKERSELASEIDVFSSRMKEKGGNVFSDSSALRDPVIPLTASVPVAGERDASAWRKLSVSRARAVFSDWEEWRNVAEDWHPLFFSFRMSRARKQPGDSEQDWIRAEVVQAGTLAEARKWAAYFRFKYMDDSERSRGANPEQIARATNADAFPDLGNENISWRGRMNSAFLPEEETAETLIIFIRGTTVVCLKSERPDFSVLPFARAFDALLLAPAPAADAEQEPSAE